MLAQLPLSSRAGLYPIMTITVSLLITLATFLLLGGWVLAVAIRHAEEGYEDALGFNSGKPPALAASLPQIAGSPDEVAGPVSTPTFASVNLSADTATQAVTIFVSGTGRAASALYRRHRRSGNSSASFPVQTTASSTTGSASPFAIQCAVTRERANRVDSASPFPVSAKPAFGDGAGL